MIMAQLILSQCRPAAPLESAPENVRGAAEIADNSDNKTDLDLEIERYQREIEEKQRRQRSGPSVAPASPYRQHGTHACPGRRRATARTGLRGL